MKTKTFFWLVAGLIAASGLAVGAFFLISNLMEEETPDTPEVYSVSDEDSVALSTTVDDFLSRAGDFGVQYVEEESQMGDIILELQRQEDIENVDSENYVSRADAYAGVRNLISEDSSLWYSDRELSEWSDEYDFFEFPNYEISEADITVPNNGSYLVGEENSLTPTVEVSVTLTQKTRTSFVFSDEEEGMGIYVSGLNVEERETITAGVFVSVTLFLDEDGVWRIYAVDAGQYSPMLVVNPPGDNAVETLNTHPEIIREYRIDLEDEDPNHDH